MYGIGLYFRKKGEWVKGEEAEREEVEDGGAEEGRDGRGE